MTRQDIIELTRGYIGCAFFTIDGCLGWPVISAMKTAVGWY